jgi:hypothetical protein
MIVGAIKKHRTSQDWDGAGRSQRRTHGSGESARVAAADVFLVPYYSAMAKGKRQR